MTDYEPLFAKYYDYLVHDRREAFATDEDMDFLKKAFSENCAGTVQDVLDVGCGTGKYIISLVRDGFRVTGIDDSPDMLAQCEARLKQLGLTARLVEGDLMELREAEEYDAVLCIGSVICYFLETEAIIKALSLFREALRPGGLLVLEVWNILANTSLFGTTNVYESCDDEVKVINTQSITYDPFRSIYRGKLDVAVTDHGEKYSFSREEVLRVMTVGEVVAYLEAAGFTNISAHSRKDTLEPESGDEELVFLASRPG